MLRSQDATRRRPYGRLQWAQYCVSYTGGLINKAERRRFKFPHLSAQTFPQHLGAQGAFQEVERSIPDLFVQKRGHAVQVVVLSPRDPVQLRERKEVRGPL